MKLRAILLFLMITWDASLHITDLLGIQASNPLYLSFPLAWGFISYDIFWSVFWVIGALIAISLISDKVVNKINVNVDEARIQEALDKAFDKVELNDNKIIEENKKGGENDGER